MLFIHCSSTCSSPLCTNPLCSSSLCTSTLCCRPSRPLQRLQRFIRWPILRAPTTRILSLLIHPPQQLLHGSQCNSSCSRPCYKAYYIIFAPPAILIILTTFSHQNTYLLFNYYFRFVYDFFVRAQSSLQLQCE